MCNLCLVGLVCLVGLIGLVGLVGLVWFCWSCWFGGSGWFGGSLFDRKMIPGDHFVMHVAVIFGGFVGPPKITFGVVFLDFWTFEVTFFGIFASWGHLSTCLVSWGGLGTQT